MGWEVCPWLIERCDVRRPYPYSNAQNSVRFRLFENVFQKIDKLEGVFDLGERNIIFLGDFVETAVLIAVRSDDQIVRKGCDGVDHPFVVPSRGSSFRAPADMCADDENPVLLAIIDDFFLYLRNNLGE